MREPRHGQVASRWRGPDGGVGCPAACAGVHRAAVLAGALLVMLMAGCCAPTAPRSAATDPASGAAGGAAEGASAGLAAEHPPLVGVVSRAQVEAAEPAWVAQEVEAAPDAASVTALAEVAPGAEVVVYFGSWCSDSERELSRLWRGFDDAGIDGRDLPFTIEYVAVDRDKLEPAERLAGIELDYVPTFVVHRDGAEVGRIVESAPGGIEHDLLALLSGAAAGVVSSRDDLASP